MQARHYYQIIKRPMDLSVIRAKLNKRSSQHYHSPDQFIADVFLMFRNCAKFNYVGRTLRCVQIQSAVSNNINSSLSLATARLRGGPGRPQSGGVLPLPAQRGFSRQSVPCGRGRFRQRRVRRGLQGSGWRVPLAREEGAVPQEEEEEKFPQVQKIPLLKPCEWNAKVDLV